MSEEREVRVMALVSPAIKLEPLPISLISGDMYVVLGEISGNRALPIGIGEREAFAIHVVMEGIELERPLSQDLLAYIIKGLRVEVVKVVVTDLRDNTYYAEIHLKTNDDKESIIIDARPSDSIALALRMKAPIYVSEEVLISTGRPKEEF